MGDGGWSAWSPTSVTRLWKRRAGRKCICRCGKPRTTRPCNWSCEPRFHRIVWRPGIRTALRPLDPNLPVREFVTFQDLVDRAVSPRRFLVLLLAGFAAFALILASLGIYAVISFSVSQRVQEIGIRMALGASATDLQRRIVLRTLGLAAFGLALGMAGVASFVEHAGQPVVWDHDRRPGDLYRGGNAADRGCGDRRIYSRLEGVEDRSDGCVAVELGKATPKSCCGARVYDS